MKTWIIKHFPKSEDANLIEKHFAAKLSHAFFEVLAEGKEAQLLEAAKRLEAAEAESGRG